METRYSYQNNSGCSCRDSMPQDWQEATEIIVKFQKDSNWSLADILNTAETF